MGPYRHFVILTMLSIFSASTYVEAIAMTVMSTNEPTTSMENMDMDGCNDCQSETGACGDCVTGCTSHFATAISLQSRGLVLPIESFSIDSLRSYNNYSGPPDPFPPRSFNLI